MKIITVASLKGGCSKTTISVNLANAIAKTGKTVLVCDFDSNNNLTDYFCRDISDVDISARNAYHFLSGKATVNMCLHETKLSQNIGVLPATIALHNTAIECGTNPMNMLSARDQLKSLKRFQYCIIDTAPSRDYCTQAGIFSADEIIIPINYSRWSIQAVDMLIADINKISDLRKKVGSRPPNVHIIPSCVTHGEDERMRESTILQYSKHTILKSSTIRSAGDRGVVLMDNYDAAKMFDKLAKEFV